MYLMLAAALMPVIILALYIGRMDAKPEPFQWLLRAFFAGVLICFPVGMVENFISGILFPTGAPQTLFGTTIQAFLVAAVPEEAAKLLALWLILRKNPYFDEHFDGIVYAVYIGLGFAGLENILYVLQSGESWASVAFMRAFLAVPGHYAFAIIMGYYYTKYHFVKRSPLNAVKIFLAPVLAHGVYDSLAMSGSVDPVAGSICFLILIYFCVKLQKAAQKKVLDLAQQ